MRLHAIAFTLRNLWTQCFELIMHPSRSKMDASLKSVVIPYLRGLGFSGSLPHLRRIKKNGIDLITFQFDKWGGAFIIEVSHCGPKGITTSWGEKISPKIVTAWYMPMDSRFRIHPRDGSGTDAWFRFDRLNLFGNIYEKTAHKAVEMIAEKAIPVWNAFDSGTIEQSLESLLSIGVSPLGEFRKKVHR